MLLSALICVDLRFQIKNILGYFLSEKPQKRDRGLGQFCQELINFLTLGATL
jgi:hypothetical protein